MEMKKKLLCLACILALALSVTSCSKNTYEGFLNGFEEYLQENFPEDDISIKSEEGNFWIYLGNEKSPDMLTFMVEGDSIFEDDERMNEEIKTIHLSGSFLQYDSEQSAKFFGGFLDYLSKDIDGTMEGAQEVLKMINEYSSNPMAEREVDKGKVSLLPLDTDNAIMSIVFTAN